MECLIQIALHRFPVSADGIHHGRGRRTARSKQSFNEADRLLGVQSNQVVLIDDLTRDFAGMYDHERSHRGAFNGCRSLEKLLVCRANPGDKSLALLLFPDRIHVQKVRRLGTHCKHDCDVFFFYLQPVFVDDDQTKAPRQTLSLGEGPAVRWQFGE